MASPGLTHSYISRRSIMQRILFIDNDPSLQEGCQMASAGSQLLEFLHDHAEAPGTILRVYEVYHPLDKHDAEKTVNSLVK